MKGVKIINNNLHILLSRDGKWIIAHCLEMNICGKGKTEKGAIKDLISCIENHVKYAIENNIVDAIFDPAPQEYWEMFYRSLVSNSKEKISQHPRLVLKTFSSNLEIAYVR